MARILIITSEMAGRINISCELARRLHTRGHDATVASPAPIGERVAARGVPFSGLAAAAPGPAVAPRTTNHPEEPPQARAAAPSRVQWLAERLRLLRTVSARRNAAAEALGPERLKALLEDHAPDLVLIDIELPVHVMTAASTQIPVVLWTSMLSLWKRPGLPPLGDSIQPGVGFAGSRTGIELAWLRFRAWKWQRAQRQRIGRMGTNQISVLRSVAERVGFPFRQETARYEWLIPFVYRSLPVISFNAFELEFPHDPPEFCRYVGPVLDAGRESRTTQDRRDATDALAQIYARRTGGQSSALIYCSFGAWHKDDDRAFLQRIVTAVEGRSDWELVLGLGGRVDPETLGDLPPNVHLFPWAPQLEVLTRADVAVHHAGISSVNECIVSGVPMVMYPFDFLDQPGNAARVAYHGLGVVGDRANDSPLDIRLRIERLLEDRSVQARTEVMRAAFLEYDATERAVRTIESHL